MSDMLIAGIIQTDSDPLGGELDCEQLISGVITAEGELVGELSGETSLIGEMHGDAQLDGELSTTLTLEGVLAAAYTIGAEKYDGEYDVTPQVDKQLLKTKHKYMTDDVRVHAIPYFEVGNTGGGTTVYIADEIEME